MGSRHDSGGLGGIRIGASSRSKGIRCSGHDLGGLGGAMTGSRCGRAFGGPLAHLLDGILGSNSYKAFLLDLALEAQHKAHVARTLLSEFEASERKQESRRF